MFTGPVHIQVNGGREGDPRLPFLINRGRVLLGPLVEHAEARGSTGVQSSTYSLEDGSSVLAVATPYVKSLHVHLQAVTGGSEEERVIDRVYVDDCHTGLAVQSDARTAPVLGVDNDFVLRADGFMQTHKWNLYAEGVDARLPPLGPNAKNSKLADKWVSARTIDDPYSYDWWTAEADPYSYPTEEKVARYIILNRLASFSHEAMDGFVYGGLGGNCGLDVKNSCWWPYFFYEEGVSGEREITGKTYIHCNLREIARRPNGASYNDDVVFAVSDDKTIKFPLDADVPTATIPGTLLDSDEVDSSYYGTQWVICDITKDGRRILLQRIAGSWGMSYGGRPNLELGAVFELTFDVEQSTSGGYSLNVSQRQVADPWNDYEDNRNRTFTLADSLFLPLNVVSLTKKEKCFTGPDGEPDCEEYISEIVLEPGAVTTDLSSVNAPIVIRSFSYLTNEQEDYNRKVVFTACYSEIEEVELIHTEYSRNVASTTPNVSLNNLSAEGTLTVSFDVDGMEEHSGYESNMDLFSCTGGIDVTVTPEIASIAATNEMSIISGSHTKKYSINESTTAELDIAGVYSIIPGRLPDTSLIDIVEPMVTGSYNLQLTQVDSELIDLSETISKFVGTRSEVRTSGRLLRLIRLYDVDYFMPASEDAFNGDPIADGLGRTEFENVYISSDRPLPNIELMWAGNWDSMFMWYGEDEWHEAYIDFLGSTKQYRIRSFDGAWWLEQGAPAAQQYMRTGPVHIATNGTTINTQVQKVPAGQAMYSGEVNTPEKLIANMHHSFNTVAYNHATGQLALDFPYPVSWHGKWPESWSPDFEGTITMPLYLWGVFNTTYSLDQEIIRYTEWNFTTQRGPSQ